MSNIEYQKKETEKRIDDWMDGLKETLENYKNRLNEEMMPMDLYRYLDHIKKEILMTTDEIQKQIMFVSGLNAALDEINKNK